MKIAGIIAEYNPFHEGHRFHIEAARRRTGADYVVVLMSGHFVQRGEPALYDPSYRTECALDGGADAVFEIPVYYSTSSAREFAEYGVHTLSDLGCDYISFGSEIGDLKELEKIADAKDNETPEMSESIRRLLKGGASYPEALSAASGSCRIQSNDILGTEYIRTIRKDGLSIEPVAIKREGAEYNDVDMNSRFPSARAIRQSILSGETESSFPALGPDDIVQQLQDNLILLSEEKYSFNRFMDVSSGIAERLAGIKPFFRTYEELVNAVKTKQYTYSRISRCLIHVLLLLSDEDRPEPYTRLLGFRRNSEEVLSEIKSRSKITVVTKAADSRELLKSDAYACDVYRRAFYKKTGAVLPDLFSSKIVIR